MHLLMWNLNNAIIYIPAAKQNMFQLTVAEKVIISAETGENFLHYITYDVII